MMRRQHHEGNNEPQSRAINELSSLLMSLLRSPVPFTDHPPHLPWRRRGAGNITPAGFAYLMVGVSAALMLCGSVTFFIGFLMMPWVLGLVTVLYLAGIVSAVSLLGKSLFCCALPAHPPPRPPPPPPPPPPTASLPSSPRKGVNDVPAWKLL